MQLHCIAFVTTSQNAKLQWSSIHTELYSALFVTCVVEQTKSVVRWRKRETSGAPVERGGPEGRSDNIISIPIITVTTLSVASITILLLPRLASGRDHTFDYENRHNHQILRRKVYMFLSLMLTAIQSAIS